MPRTVSSTFFRFCLFGAAGFAVDGGVLTALVNGMGWHHYPARAISFTLAVSLTWWLNRKWTFARTHDTRSEYLRYFSIQGIGAAINLGTYVIVIESVPALARVPIVPLAIGAALALVFNFLASRRFVFGQPSLPPGPELAPPETSSYSGRENLDAMKHAKLYNRYLERLVQRHSPGGKTVDFGAGGGTFAIPLTQAGLDVDCIEPDAGLRQDLEAAGLAIHESLATIAPESVDYIYSLNVLEHIEDDAGMLTALGERLRPGGRLLLYVPAFQLLYSSMDSKVGHFRRYGKAGLRALVEAAGLRVETARYVDSLGFFASLLFKCFGNSDGSLSPTSIRLYDRLAFPLSRLADLLVSPWIGKNLLVVAARRADG